MRFKSIEKEDQLSGKRVLMRVDVNVDVRDGVVRDDFRITRLLPTLQFLQKEGARTVLVGHIGEKEGGTLLPIFKYHKKYIDVTFVEDFWGEEGKDAADSVKKGQFVLFENLRTHPGEVGRDEVFARRLASYAELYVNEAFSESHRNYTSLVLLPKLLPACVGPLFIEEYDRLSEALNPPRPSLIVVGGIKAGVKVPLIKHFLGVADVVYAGGILAAEFFKTQGYSIGGQLLSGDDFHLKTALESERLRLPLDINVGGEVKNPAEMRQDDRILDIGPDTAKMLDVEVNKAKFILWNGPIGDYKLGYTDYNADFARSLAESDAQTIVGGGDTVASLKDLGLLDKFSFVSTAGGAMIQFLSGKPMPGIDALMS